MRGRRSRRSPRCPPHGHPQRGITELRCAPPPSQASGGPNQTSLTSASGPGLTRFGMIPLYRNPVADKGDPCPCAFATPFRPCSWLVRS